jgi:alkylhydroperoxidase/carboxymuconolactone decarboxylase family protein YurZ
MREIPRRFVQFTDEYPEIARAYEQLGAACHLAGPLPKKERALIKLGISVGAWLEGAVHSHVRKALEAGASPQEIRHTALLALPTIGFPSTMAVLTWIDDVLEAPSEGREKRRSARAKAARRKR